MCPHIRPRCAPYFGTGQQCGLTAEHCRCVCLLCGEPMRARRVCGALRDDGTRCTWGSNRSPDPSTPEASLSPERVVPPRKVVWWKDPAPPKPGPAPSVAPSFQALASAHPGDGRTPLINFVSLTPGGRDPPMPATPKRGRPLKVRASQDVRFSLESTPTSSPPPTLNPIPHPRPPTIWNRPPKTASIPPPRPRGE
jgi:hypothetical protein